MHKVTEFGRKYSFAKPSQILSVLSVILYKYNLNLQPSLTNSSSNGLSTSGNQI
ncbi:hypothetical protein SAMN05443144_12117 [Fodinibius roseus]|uniref:Uncharacterized protein n=1 Tax=Fodinibius roseus TaxID=1194090 RepID=A0A1M5HTW9_9BACT|nr:hypothetical protein SAMN05443144_12117 [Fodinibius roseus]